MFSFLANQNQNQVVGFSLTPGVGLEAVILDKNKTRVENYGRKKVDYNFSQRNIQDYSQFKTALAELIQEMRIPKKAYAYLVLPNVCFGFQELARIGDNETYEALIGSACDFYIFKKEDPVVGWSEVPNYGGSDLRRLAYSAFQKTDVDEIRDIFSSLDLQLAGIETAYSATLRGLNLTGRINDAVLMNSSWTALVINTNSFSIFQMEGKNLIDCNDTPLALKSFSPEEAYQVIISNVSQLLDNFSSSQLFIISQTDDISANSLKNMMQFDRDVVAIESNRHSNRPLIDVVGAVGDFNETNSLTLAALGAADTKSSFGLNLNILDRDSSSNLGVYFTTNVGGKEVEVTSATVSGICMTVAIFGLLIFGPIAGGAWYYDTNVLQTQIGDLNSEAQNLDRQIEELSKVEVKQVEEIDMTDIIDQVANSNVSAINFYDSISTDIPKNIWLTKYYNKAGDRLIVRGVAESIVDVYEYYKNLKIVSPQSGIKLNELKVIASPTKEDENEENIDDFFNTITMDKEVDRLYSFEISNTQVQLDLSAYTSRNKKNSDYSKKSGKIDESDLLQGPPATNIEQPSDQMSPAR